MKPVTMVRKCLPILVLLLFLLFTGCSANSGLEVREAWARPGLAGNNSAVYFVINNNTRQADTLTAITGDIAAMIDMHMSSTDTSGVSSMQPMDRIEVPKNSTMEFKPGGYHIMLMNLKKDLKPGDTFPLTLHFSESGEKTVQVQVKDQ